MIQLEWIRGLIEMIEGSELDTIEISRFGTRIRLSKSPPIQVMGGISAAPVAADLASCGSGLPHSTPLAAGSETSAMAAGLAATPEPELFEEKSPMVGTFYRAPSPDAPSYVEPGDHVRQGQTLCILEAMKLMNELEAETSGIIREICVGNGEPVEFGQVLFRIDPDGSS